LRNRNSYLTFKTYITGFELFNLAIVNFYFKNIDPKRFHEWQQKGYIQSIIKGWYAFGDINITEKTLFYWSNTIRKPSYISLTSAFSYYGFIPEQSFGITAITTLKTINYKVLNYTFTYNTLKSNLLFGFENIKFNNKHINMALMEKAILDYLYLHNNIKTVADIEALRWNKNQNIDWVLFDKYLAVLDNKQVSQRAHIFKQYMTCF
jgi:predicted transcriptional regulator of viral defense system